MPAILIAAMAGFLAGVAYADFIVTWKQHRHISIDAIFLSGIAVFCGVTLVYLPAG